LHQQLREGAMSRQTWMKIANPLLFLAFITQAVTGILFKAGTMKFDTFRLVHPRVGYAVVVLGLIHLIVNWQWVKTALFGIRPKRPVPKTA